MDWFTSLDGVDELETTEAFLDYFGISYEPLQVRSKRLHIMHHFNQQIKKSQNGSLSDRAGSFLTGKNFADRQLSDFPSSGSERTFHTGCL